MNAQLSVAAPWSLTHYIPLNGFHPLYRALFESRPEWVSVSTWDNIELSQKLRGEESFRTRLLGELAKDSAAPPLISDPVEKGYFRHFGISNFSLTRLLPGDIEFHHTAPFPSFQRPFVFHCEAFAPIFFPLAHQGSEGFASLEVQRVREHYSAIFEHPLCLGIFSHIPQTLDEISRFFSSPTIDKKLHASRIGLYGSESIPEHLEKSDLQAPIFLFVNSANQNPRNFSLRGGHIALRYWQRLFPEPGEGRLIMRCARPADLELAEYGVDLEWLRRHEGKSVIWIESYLSESELDSLMQASHFLFLPSMSLHSVSIMSAMAAGAIPIVSDTVGTDRYVTDNLDGVVLRGIRAANWLHDAETGLMFNCFQRNIELEDDLVEQLVDRIGRLLSHPEEYLSLQHAALSKARESFSGPSFSQDFWGQVQRCYQESPSFNKNGIDAHEWPELNRCLAGNKDWSRLFTSATQPVMRLDAGSGHVTELGGCLIFTPVDGSTALHHWSPVAEYIDEEAPSLSFAGSIKGLSGCYLAAPHAEFTSRQPSRLVAYVAKALMPFPWLFSAASVSLQLLRRAKRLITPGKVVIEQQKRAAMSVDIELIAENVKGLNIIRHGHMFYGVSPAAGEFIPMYAQAGKYDPCLVGSSLKDLLRQVEELPGGDDTELLEKGIGGFNLVRYANVFYAIPESEGDFDIARVHAGFYSCTHSGLSVDTVKAAILESTR
ncbi:MAG: hypothetical protein ACQZ2J_09325 [Pseudomonas piscis]|uniref:hypothetical protein n=1 Tax=Pseudomonas piscis TaxID=2614538 RepID=UPI003D28A7D5